MNDEYLTAFDRYMLSKKVNGNQFDTHEEINEKEKETSRRNNRMSDEYVAYVQQQLRRTGPSDSHVMTEEEFLNSNASTATVKAAREKRNNVQFKKFGKYLLIGYVIIMLALALIVIVKTTTSNNHYADAAQIEESDTHSQIVKMPDEQEECEDNWFDKLCDSLKK